MDCLILQGALVLSIVFDAIVLHLCKGILIAKLRAEGTAPCFLSLIRLLRAGLFLLPTLSRACAGAKVCLQGIRLVLGGRVFNAARKSFGQAILWGGGGREGRQLRFRREPGV